MSRSRIKEAQADRSLVSRIDLEAGFKTYLALSFSPVASTSAISPTVGQVVFSGPVLADLDLIAEDVLELDGTGGADGNYRVSSVINATTLRVVTASSMAVTAGGTARLFYKEGSRYTTVVSSGWTWLSGNDVQDALDAADVQIQAARDLVPASLFGLDVGTAAVLPAVFLNGVAVIQPLLGSLHCRAWIPAGSSTTLDVLGSAAPTASGTATTRNVTNTNIFNAQRRIGYVSAGTAGSASGIRLAALQYALGNVTGGGFLAVFRFGVSDAAAVANARTFVGLVSQTTAIGNVNPSTLINVVGIASNSGDANFSIIHNDGAGAATVVPLGALFPANTRNTDLYSLKLYSPPGLSYVEYRVDRENTGDFVTGRLTTNLPSVFLAPQLWRNNGTDALAVGLDVMGVGLT